MVLMGVVASATALAAPPSTPINCLPSRIVAFEAAQPDPELRFGAGNLPGVVLGPPGDSGANEGSLSVASLGVGGFVTLAWDRIVIEDRPGPDFTVYENGFFLGAQLPQSAADDYIVFSEPARVEVSLDGETWFAFPVDEDALAQVGTVPVDRALAQALSNVAGVTPTTTGNWTIPEDPAVFDPTGPGGLSGAGGDAFDLADVGLSEARFVRVTDNGVLIGFTGAAEGFDLDAVVVHHGRPLPVPGVDLDGDRLPDAAETTLYGSQPGSFDSDGDGLDDGREAASCRSPSSIADSAVTPPAPTLFVEGGTCTTLRWTFLGTTISTDVFRGDLSAIVAGTNDVDLGDVDCLTGDTSALFFDCDGSIPDAGEAFFYLAARSDGDLGRGSALTPRAVNGACP